jgi:hypothetical protein
MNLIRLPGVVGFQLTFNKEDETARSHNSVFNHCASYNNAYLKYDKLPSISNFQGFAGFGPV